MTARFVPAWHGTAVMPVEKSAPIYGGTPSGIVLSIRGGPTIYHIGDTDLYSDMALVSRYTPVDWMLVCVGGQFTMGPEPSRRRCEAGKSQHGHPDALRDIPDFGRHAGSI